jgi:hypothetical protein
MRAADDFNFISQRMGILKPSISDNIIIPKSWTSVLKAIQQQPNWSTAIIAGGALRDSDNERPIKDVDIFVPYAENSFERLISATGKHDLTKVGHNKKLITSTGANIDPVHFTFKLDGWKVEVSQKVCPDFDYLKLLEGFDIGLCMISYDGNDIYKSQEYIKDKDNKTITIVRPTGGGEMTHAERIQKKYPNWTIIPLP